MKGNQLTVRKPSEKSAELFDELVSAIKDARQTVEGIVKKLVKQLRIDGFQDKEIGKMIRERLDPFYSRQAIAAVLPAETKAKPRGDPHGPVSKLSLLNQEKPDGEESDFPKGQVFPLVEVDTTEPEEEDTQIWQIKPADYRIEDIEQYDKAMLCRVVEYLHSEKNKYKKQCEILASELKELKDNPEECPKCGKEGTLKTWYYKPKLF